MVNFVDADELWDCSQERFRNLGESCRLWMIVQYISEILVRFFFPRETQKNHLIYRTFQGCKVWIVIVIHRYCQVQRRRIRRPTACSAGCAVGNKVIAKEHGTHKLSPPLGFNRQPWASMSRMGWSSFSWIIRKAASWWNVDHSNPTWEPIVGSHWIVSFPYRGNILQQMRLMPKALQTSLSELRSVVCHWALLCMWRLILSNIGYFVV